ncbi:MAG: hypothetical protein DGJ47_000569 [Rickettsiaceae bacterium]
MILMNMIAYFLFQDFAQSNDISLLSLSANNWSSMEFLEYIKSFDDPLMQLLPLYISSLAITILLNGVYFVFFWCKYQATPGAMILNTQVVNKDNLEALSLKHSIARYAGFYIAFLGIWSMFFNNQKMAWHDKMAGSIVIKK